jgi:2-amino-4-hydroxy-6-hydroxymethyldihydropteridine diphosphokinase
MDYFLGLGSNLGDREKNLSGARILLEDAGVKVLRQSSLYRTEPVDIPDQPWFLNQVIEVRTHRTPHELLALAKTIEGRLKRRRFRAKGPRTIDVDILLAGETVMVTPELVIPHPRLEQRNFVLIPLAEVAPSEWHPVLQRTAAELVRMSLDASGVVRWEKGGAAGHAEERSEGERIKPPRPKASVRSPHRKKWS